MAIFKCKMCGGDINAETGAAFGTCDSCGITSTLPKDNDEKLVNLFNRANHFRRLNEFDKALSTYENILNEDNTNAEAHWCATLCRYGIEYVEDPRTHERVPTCHRVQYVPIMTDADYLAALEYAQDDELSDPELIALLKRGYMFIEEEDWDRAEEYFERVLEEQDYAPAYIGKLCALWRRQLKDMEKLISDNPLIIPDPNNYDQVVRFESIYELTVYTPL